MNAEIFDDNSEPDYATAHFVALHKLDSVDLEQGSFNCTAYLSEYHRELGEAPPPFTRELVEALDSMTRLGDDPVEAQLVAEAFLRSHLEIPAGLNDLPISWGFAIRKLILETHWPEFENCTIKDVFGWSYVSRFNGFLHIHFEKPVPAAGTPWCDIGQLIYALHQTMEPGPYTHPNRLCEFTRQ
jgi:hypothetical protein